jgi:hypothetical protein
MCWSTADRKFSEASHRRLVATLPFQSFHRSAPFQTFQPVSDAWSRREGFSLPLFHERAYGAKFSDIVYPVPQNAQSGSAATNILKCR